MTWNNNPTQFITDQATKLVRIILENDNNEIAIEMVELYLKQAYAQGLQAGRRAGFKDAQDLAKTSIEKLKKIASS